MKPVLQLESDMFFVCVCVCDESSRELLQVQGAHDLDVLSRWSFYRIISFHFISNLSDDRFIKMILGPDQFQNLK